ncbi:MAG: hypothetical protein AABY66_05690, partial [Nitrospirota bacterium]
IGRFITPDPLTWGPDDERGFRLAVNSPDGESISKFRKMYRGGIQYVGAFQPLSLHHYAYCYSNPSNLIDPFGLWTYGFGISSMVGGAAGYAWQTLFVFDDNGNMGIATSTGYGGYNGIGISAGVTFQWTTADTIYDLRGDSLAIGWGWSVGIGSYAVEYLAADTYQGADYTIGLGWSPWGINFAQWGFQYNTKVTGW